MQPKSKKFAFIYLTTIALFIIAVSLILYADNLVSSETEEYISDNTDKIPSVKVGLLLGTSKMLGSNRPNYYFKHRIQAALQLYKSGKIQYIIVSGDNSKVDYNEPKDMQEELIKLGIPEDKIYLDYAGFRTFDSVIRTHKIFGQSKFIIISQPFHNQRAVFIGRKNNLEAYGFNAKNVDAYAGFKTNVREYFARVKLFLDLFLGTQPKYLGNKIIIK